MAKKFHFAMEVVARLREQANKAQLRALASAVSARQRAQSELSELVDQSSRIQTALSTLKQQRTLDVAALRQTQLHAGHLARRVDDCKQVLVKRDRVFEVERRKLAETTRNLKAIQKLREKHLKKHLDAIRKEEQFALDEAAAQRFTRRKVRARREVALS